MKILRNKFSETGSTLLLAVVATGIIGLMLTAYLSLVKVQNISGFRSQAWNASIPTIEAGIEDGMSHLNMHGTTNLACDGWQACTSSGHSGYAIERTVGENKYNVFIYNWVPNATTNIFPVIEARGFVNTPVMVASANGSKNSYMFAATANTPPPQLARGVRAVTTLNSLFSKGLVAKGQIDMNGNNIATDSFDSLDPAHSNLGRYESTKAKSNGDVATDSSLTNSVNVGSATIHGSVATGPGGSVKIGNGGTVTGKITDDMNVAFPDVTVPFANGGYATAPDSNSGGTQTFNGGNYKLSSLSLSGHGKVQINGDVSIWVTGGFSMSGQSEVDIAAGAKLQIYTGANSSISGNGFINQGDPSTCTIWGLPGCTSVSFSGNAAFTGCLYAPNADFSMSGGGNNTYDFVGAAITKSVTMNGHFNFHYDEALRVRGPYKGYVLNSWNEMTPAEVATVPPYH